MPKSEADALIASTGGDPRAMERALSLVEGFLDSNKVVRIDIDNAEQFNLGMLLATWRALTNSEFRGEVT
jgi:hypothetical protein